MLKRYGFTLVELLVVITIIVILLSLLTPALDEAIYQVAKPFGDSTRRAEMAVCATTLKGIATGVQTYAAGSRRYYPARPTGVIVAPYFLTHNTWDSRPVSIADPRR